MAENIMDEIRRKIAEIVAIQRENCLRLAKHDAEINAQLKAVSDNLKIVSDDLTRNEKLVGNIGAKLGGIAERFLLPNIVEKFNEKGFRFSTVSANVDIYNDEGNEVLTEIDAMLENGKSIIAVEAKTDLRVGYVNSHISRLEMIRKLKRFKGKRIYGAMSAPILHKKALAYAQKSGLFILKQPDTATVQFEPFPKGCSAKAW